MKAFLVIRGVSLPIIQFYEYFCMSLSALDGPYDVFEIFQKFF